MKIKSSKGKLLYGIQMVQNTVSAKASLPILLNILIEAGGKIGPDKLRLTTTDLEITSRCAIPVEVQEEGGITIPARILFEIIKELPEREVEIQVKENNMKIKCEGASFTVFGLPINEFPTPPDIKEGTAITINDNILKEMIRKTKFSISTDETRHALTGIYVIVKENTIEMVATDGHRLSYIKEGLPQPSKQEISAILPIKPLNEIVRTFPEEGEKVKILMDKNYISFNVGDISLNSRLIEGTFPNYEQVIPKKPDKQIIVNTQDLLTCLRRVSIVSDERSSLIKLKADKDFLTVSGNTPSSGEGSDNVGIESKNGDIEIGFNARYLMDVLRAIDSEKTEINMNTPSSPVLIKPVSEESTENYLNVVMPLRL